MPKPSPAARARKIKLIIFDVDGVLTDGTIWIFPAPGASQGSPPSALERSAPGFSQPAGHTTSMIEAKGFHAHDGTAISLARQAGIKTGIITKRVSETVALRAHALRMDHIHQGVQDKAGRLAEILKKDGITAAEAAFVGDDVIDLGPLTRAGLAVVVGDGVKEARAAAHYVTKDAGGRGAVREAVELILRAQGQWAQFQEKYAE